MNFKHLTLLLLWLALAGCNGGTCDCLPPRPLGWEKYTDFPHRIEVGDSVLIAELHDYILKEHAWHTGPWDTETEYISVQISQNQGDSLVYTISSKYYDASLKNDMPSAYTRLVGLLVLFKGYPNRQQMRPEDLDELYTYHGYPPDLLAEKSGKVYVPPIIERYHQLKLVRVGGKWVGKEKVAF